MSVVTSKQLYQGKEYHEHATRAGLLSDEIYLVQKHLDPRAKTLEAATGGGRILYALKELGFTSLHGFDFVPEFIDAAKAKDPTHAIDFQVQDATKPDYPDESFDQLLYLGQVISSLDSPTDPFLVFQEAYRIAKPGAIMIMSFLSWDTRISRPLHAAYTNYLKFIRTLTGSKRQLQSQPWLKHGGWMNWGAVNDAPPFLHYYKLHEISEHIRLSGFQLIEVGSTYQISHCEGMYPNIIELAQHPIRGAVFAVCRKPARGANDNSR